MSKANYEKNAQSNQIAEESREETLDNTLPMSYSDFEYKQPGNSAMKSKSQPLETQERVQKTLTPSANKGKEYLCVLGFSNLRKIPVLIC